MYVLLLARSITLLSVLSLLFSASNQGFDQTTLALTTSYSLGYLRPLTLSQDRWFTQTPAGVLNQGLEDSNLYLLLSAAVLVLLH